MSMQQQPGPMGRTAEQAGGVVSTAGHGVSEVASEAGTQVREVAGQARQQADRVVGQARTEVRQQLEDRSSQAASQLRTLSEQISALREGRVDQAGQLTGYLDEARDTVARFASRLEQRGPQGVADDLSRFARRRPGLFLVGAGVVGFAAGRMVRAASAASREQSQGNGMAANGRQFAGTASGYQPGDETAWQPPSVIAGQPAMPGVTIVEGTA